MAERKNMAEWVMANGITIKVTQTDSNPNMDNSENMDHWRCCLRRNGRQLTVIFSMGSGHNGRQPEASDVLDCLASDADSYNNSSSFEDWAADYRYDANSRTAERTYNTIGTQTGKLRRFLGNILYKELLYNVDRK